MLHIIIFRIICKLTYDVKKIVLCLFVVPYPDINAIRLKLGG